MARKSSAARAEESKPLTVGERRRALRGAKEPASGPSVKKAEIDLTKKDARKALAAIHPRPTSETMIDATPELEAAAYEYVEQRDAATIATEKKEIAGNVLCNAIAKNLGIRGDGWTATWDTKKGEVDWSRLTKDLNIDDATIAKYRKPESRTLTVRETAEEG